MATICVGTQRIVVRLQKNLRPSDHRSSSAACGWATGRRARMRISLTITLALSTVLLQSQEPPTATGAARLPHHVIAIVQDQSSPYFDRLIEGFRVELENLAAGKYTFELRDTYNADGEPQRSAELLREAISAPDVGVVYTAGHLVSSAAIQMDENERRLPIVSGSVEFGDLNSALISPRGTSLVKDYTFIQSRRIASDLEKLAELTGERRVHALLDAHVYRSLEERIKPLAAALEERTGVDVEIVPVGDTAASCIEALPPSARAVYVPILISMSDAERANLFQSLTSHNLFSFSILGVIDVERGAFAGLAGDNWSAIYRRTALHLHQILLGIPTDLLPVTLRVDDQLVINMRTALSIGWSPDYDTALAARFIHEDDLFQSAGELTLEEAMALAAEQNPQVLAASAEATVQARAVDVARASYRPQLSAVGSSAYQGVSERILATTPHHAESYALGAELRQLLFSDRVLGQIDAQKHAAAASERDLESVRLDATADAGASFLDVLTAEALYVIEQENLVLVQNNLQLAKLRYEIGAAEPSEVFRWQASEARGKATLFSRDADRRNARIALNVLLGVPRTQHWDLKDIELEEDDLYFMNDVLSPLLGNLKSFHRFIEFLRVESGKRAPEIVAFEETLAAQGILLRERSRRNFVPEVSLAANFDRVLQDAHRVDADSQNEWSVGLGFVVPLFEGGRRGAEVAQFRATILQLSALRDQALFLVEQRALAAAYGISSSHPGMRLSRRALEAAERNFEAIRAKYTQGTASIIDLLDAQREFLAERQNEAVTVYAYLKDIVSAQRAIAWFEFSQSPEEKEAWAAALRAFMESPPQ